MKSEMDLLNMAERQRRAWLMANRLTLFIVGLVWVGLTAYRMLLNRNALFFLIMIPVFALIRYAAYSYYKRRSLRQSMNA